MATMTKTLTLHEITAELLAIQEQLVENGGELTPELEAALDATGEAFDAKIQNYGLMIENLTESAKGYDAALQRLGALKRANTNAADRLKQRAYDMMTVAGVEKAGGPLARASIQRNSRPSIVWSGNDVGEIPEPFRRVTVSLDGDAAYTAWKTQTLPAGFVVTMGTHLRFR